MKEEKNIPVSGDIGQDTAVEDMPCEATSGEPSRLRSYLKWVRHHLPELAVWARYALPVLSVLTLLLLSFFYNVRVVSVGKRYEASIIRLIVNTLRGMHDYLGGELKEAKTTFYAILAVGAILAVICYLLALFFAGLAAYTAYRAFRAGHASEEGNRYKMVFKMAFPNRVCLFLSNALVLIPALYPHFLSFVGSRFLLIGDESVVYVLLNRPLIVIGVMLGLTLVLAFLIPRYERRKRMNMFLIQHDETPSEPEGEDVSES